MKITPNDFWISCMFLLLISACDRPSCTNTNPIFDQYKPSSNEYKTELVRQLKTVDQTKLRYWFKEFVETGDQELLIFYIQGNELCAQLAMQVEDWRKLKELREKKGESFVGAEFKNLKYDIKIDSTTIAFIFRDFDDIID